jgi:hypothetical protein
MRSAWVGGFALAIGLGGSAFAETPLTDQQIATVIVKAKDGGTARPSDLAVYSARRISSTSAAARLPESSDGFSSALSYRQ